MLYSESQKCETIRFLCFAVRMASHYDAHFGPKLNAGMYDVAIAGGTESMSMVQMPGAKVSPNPRLSKEKPEIYIGMGNAGDNVAKDFNITREEIDAFALASNQKAAAALQALSWASRAERSKP